MANQFQLSQFIFVIICISAAFTFSVDLGTFQTGFARNFLKKYESVYSKGQSSELAVSKVKEFCKRQSDEAAENIQENLKEAIQCSTSIVNEIMASISLEQSNYESEKDLIYAFYNKICAKRSQSFKCSEKFIENLQPCLTEKEKNQINFALKIQESSLDYICVNDIDPLIKVLDDGGRECLAVKADSIIECVNQTVQSIDFNEDFTFNANQCKELSNFKTSCILEPLKSCDKEETANYIDSLFNYVLKKDTNCKQ